MLSPPARPGSKPLPTHPQTRPARRPAAVRCRCSSRPSAPPPAAEAASGLLGAAAALLLLLHAGGPALAADSSTLATFEASGVFFKDSVNVIEVRPAARSGVTHAGRPAMPALSPALSPSPALASRRRRRHPRPPPPPG